MITITKNFIEYTFHIASTCRFSLKILNSTLYFSTEFNESVFVVKVILSDLRYSSLPGFNIVQVLVQGLLLQKQQLL